MDRSRLENVFGQRFSDHRSDWKGLCPFHDESTPSFLIHKEEYLANCFGCGKSGYIDVLAAEYLGISVQEARERLDIDVVDRVFRKSNRDFKPEPIIYSESWLAPYKKKVHQYVVDRGFTLETLKAAESRYDRTLGRQVFPHRNRKGELIGAVGRSCRNQDPKWYFYWGYQKGRHLYTIPETVYESTTQPRFLPLIIVEGIFDVLWLYQHGYTNVAATLGTKVTKSQLSEIKNLTDHAIILADGDVAGSQYEFKLWNGLRQTCKTSFITMPDGKDIQDIPADELPGVVNSAQTVLERSLVRV